MSWTGRWTSIRLQGTEQGFRFAYKNVRSIRSRIYYELQSYYFSLPLEEILIFNAECDEHA
jgi:hypothetical protein